MNTAAGLATTSPLQVALQAPSDPAAPVAPGGDFTAALAAACVAEPEAAMPEGMQSAAALAWLAGFANTSLPAQSQTASTQAGSTDAPADGKDGEVVPDAALSFLQGMLAQAVSITPRDTAAPAGATADGVDAADAARAVALTATPAAISGAISLAEATDAADAPAESGDTLGNTLVAGANAADASKAAPAAVPVALMRAMTADASKDSAAPAQADAGAMASLADGAVKNDAPAESSVGERLIGALADRASMRTEGAVHADSDRSAITAQNLYTSTRETVASVAGQVSSRPEVVHSTVGSPRWANELGSKLAMMSVRGQQEGSLTLTPEHLGPLEVRITVNQDSTNVWFGAQHADTRAALTDAMPRLREMFEASGLSLGQAGVSQQMPGQQARRGEDSLQRLGGASEAAEALPVKTTRISSGLLDTWA